jgi:hypothetical protein
MYDLIHSATALLLGKTAPGTPRIGARLNVMGKKKISYPFRESKYYTAVVW